MWRGTFEDTTFYGVGVEPYIDWVKVSQAIHYKDDWNKKDTEGENYEMLLPIELM